MNATADPSYRLNFEQASDVLGDESTFNRGVVQALLQERGFRLEDAPHYVTDIDAPNVEEEAADTARVDAFFASLRPIEIPEDELVEVS